MPECESMQSVKKNRRTLVEQWWHSSSGVAEQQRVANKWSAGLKPTVFHEALQVNSEDAVEGVGEGTGRLTCVGTNYLEWRFDTQELFRVVVKC